MPLANNFDFSKRITSIITTGIINNLVVDTYLVEFTGISAVTLTGIDFTTNKLSSIRLINKTGTTLTLKHNSNLSSIGNKFFLLSSQDFLLPVDGSIELKYLSGVNGYVLIDIFEKTTSSVTRFSTGEQKMSGDSIQTDFLIPHTLPGIPIALITPGNSSTAGCYISDIDTINITVSYDIPPSSGEDNLTFYWAAILV